MSERTLSNPSVQVNNDTLAIMPNSLKYKSGKGDKSVRPQSAGGNSIETVVTENAETMKSMVQLSLINTRTNIALVEGWQDETEGNTIEFMDGPASKQFRSMYIITDPEINLGVDGSIEVVFEGQPIQ